MLGGPSICLMKSVRINPDQSEGLIVVWKLKALQTSGAWPGITDNHNKDHGTAGEISVLGGEMASDKR